MGMLSGESPLIITKEDLTKVKGVVPLAGCEVVYKLCGAFFHLHCDTFYCLYLEIRDILVLGCKPSFFQFYLKAVNRVFL